jgi:hypothetical protein
LNKKISGRQLKRYVLELLQQDDHEKCESELCRLPARQTVNPLFSFLCSMDEIIKWHAVTAMGAVVSNLAITDLESARVIMRRFMWHLNDESGGIGWGCPEAMGETMARSHQLAKEYGCILLSYIRLDGNFLEHEMLQRGALWGVGRLVRARPDFLKSCASLFYPFIQSNDAHLRGLAVWAVEPLIEQESIPLLESLSNDNAELKLFREGRMAQCTVGQLAREALFAHDQNLNE